MNDPIIENQNPPSPVPQKWVNRAFYILAIIVYPIICFTVDNSVLPDYQSGEFHDYIKLIFAWGVIKCFLPFIIYTMISMLLLLISPSQFSKFFIVRLGIYTGIIVSLPYSIALLLLLHVGMFIFLILSLIPYGLFRLFMGISKKWGLEKKCLFALGILLNVEAIIYLISNFNMTETIYYQLCFLLLAISPASAIWCLIITCRTSYILIKYYEPIRFIDRRNIAVITWITGYIWAWRWAVLRAVEIYQSLPEYPPGDCYIATAAARGHLGFVGSQPVKADGGNIVWINAQLRYLKCAELCLMTTFPRIHKLFRSVYDILGPILARGMTHPILADMAYLALKPTEWATRLIMKILIPGIDKSAERLYLNLYERKTR